MQGEWQFAIMTDSQVPALHILREQMWIIQATTKQKPTYGKGFLFLFFKHVCFVSKYPWSHKAHE